MNAFVKYSFITTFGFAACFSSVTLAETNDKELAAVGKILSLSKDIPTGNIEVAVVYDPSNASSKADFDKISNIIGAGLKAPKHMLTIKGVEASNAGSVTNKVVWVTEGLGADVQAAVKGATTANKLLSISSDLACVESGNCVLGVDVGSVVKILLNSDLYSATGLSFDAAFEFMVKQI